MSILEKFFKKSTLKLHLLKLEQKIDFAFDVLYQFTPLVEAGMENTKELKHDKELIKNSILLVFRELRREPGKTYILSNHLVLDTQEKYDQYIDHLSQILLYLTNFTEKEKPDIKKYFSNNENLNSSEMSRDFEASISNDMERISEYKFYLSELDSIETDLKNKTNFKRIKFFDFE